jgi:hypothetical protein
VRKRRSEGLEDEDTNLFKILELVVSHADPAFAIIKKLLTSLVVKRSF